MATRKGIRTRRRTPRRKAARSFLGSWWVRIGAGLALVGAVTGGTVFLRYYDNYATIIDRRLGGEIFANTARIYATPYMVYAGQRISPVEVEERLRRAGATAGSGRENERSTYRIDIDGQESTITVFPRGGADVRIDFAGGRLAAITDVDTGDSLTEAALPPELVTTLFDENRAKRRLLDWEQLPPFLTDAIIASEDQRFYGHFGIDLIRAAGAALANFRGQTRQGASTLTMQLAGSFFLDRNERTWNRKLPEIFMALILEQRLTKQQILTMYVNEMYLGHRGSFAINGFGEAARAYFGKDVGDLTLGEAATLVGMLPAPNARAPHDNPENAREHRSRVLQAMLDLEMISPDQAAEARAAEILVADVTIDSNDAPYMVDFIREQLLDDFNEQDLLNGGLNVYTTLDPDLQRAAFNAVAEGIALVDEQLEARGRGVSSGRPPVQASLIALDPHTGEIRAMVGGRDYGSSQYNRITEAFRQPGSIFKPFVYAAAFETAFEPLDPADRADETTGRVLTAARAGFADRLGSVFGLGSTPKRPVGRTDVQQLAEREARSRIREQERRERLREADETPNDADGLVFDLDMNAIGPRNERGSIRSDTTITPLTTVVDEPTYFFYGENYYRPDNFGDVFAGLITLREALQRSLNVPTVKVAERVGYDRVAELVYRAGFNADIQPYPSIALGSFEVTPIEIAGAWTALANDGTRVEPQAIRRVATAEGEDLRTYPIESTRVFRPELAALMTNLLENVINRGTGAGVRSRGYTRPAAGKTGTSRDGWFAGYTTDLLVIAWVGFDDNRELDLEGSRSALPIWTSFMLEANRLYPPRPGQDVAFAPPPGIEMATIDGETLTLASPTCSDRFVQAFIRGTAPRAFCPIHAFGDGFLLSTSPALGTGALTAPGQ